MPDPMVVYDLPITQVVTDYEEFPGRTDAIYSVEVRARVSGYLDRVYFQDGMQVNKGDVLFQIDSRPFQATLDRAKATLVQAEAHAKRLNNEFRRAQILYERGVSISREEFDRYTFDHAEADAAVGTAKANVELAALDLEFTRVTAPISGRLSRRLVDPGNLVRADDTALTTIVTQDPLYVYFDVHEQAMLRIRRLIQEGKVKAKSEKEVPVQINLSDEQGFPHQGIVDFTDNRVDVNTGTLRFRAKLPNPDQMITPGLFVRVRLPIGDPHPALLIREQALQTDQGQKKVFVLAPAPPGKDDKPRFKPTAVNVGTPGVLRAGYREIQQGIKPGDLVVVLGMQKIRLGKDVQARRFDPAVDSLVPTGEQGSDSSGLGAAKNSAGIENPPGTPPALPSRPPAGGSLAAGSPPGARGARPTPHADSKPFSAGSGRGHRGR